MGLLAKFFQEKEKEKGERKRQGGRRQLKRKKETRNITSMICSFDRGAKAYPCIIGLISNACSFCPFSIFPSSGANTRSALAPARLPTHKLRCPTPASGPPNPALVQCYVKSMCFAGKI